MIIIIDKEDILEILRAFRIAEQTDLDIMADNKELIESLERKLKNV